MHAMVHPISIQSSQTGLTRPDLTRIRRKNERLPINMYDATLLAKNTL